MSRGLGGAALAVLIALAAPGAARADDTTPPVPDLVGHPMGGAVSDATASFLVSTNEGTVACAFDGAAWPCADGSTVTLSGLRDGDHTFAVSATDAAGNQGTEVRSWTVDTAAPIPMGFAPPALTRNPYASFQLFANLNWVDTPLVYRCWLDGAEMPSCPGGRYGPLADGPHTLTETIADRAGNVSNPVTFKTVIDTLAPPTTLRSDTPAHTSTARFSFASSDAQATFECRLDAGTYAPCTSPFGLARLAAGRHRFVVRAVDGAGNRDATPTVSSWVVVPPVPARLDARFRVRGAATGVRRLRLTTLPGARVAVTCRGRGCPVARRRAVAPSSGIVDVRALLPGRPLPAGTHLRIVVSARGYVRRATTFAIRDGRAPRGGSLG